jgi:hypothetical protein
MKFIINKKIVTSTNNKQQGFALLFSVLVSSLLLTIGLSIFNIALKELAISTATERSVRAYYAADSGRECAMYWDKIRGEIPGVFDEKNSGVISCGNFSGTINGTAGFNFDASNGDNTTLIATNNSPIFVAANLAGKENFFVTVVKKITNRGTFSDPPQSTDQFTQTTITSIGRDSVEGDRVERAMEIIY